MHAAVETAQAAFLVEDLENTGDSGVAGLLRQGVFTTTTMFLLIVYLTFG